jgi:hypothetical protein
VLHGPGDSVRSPDQDDVELAAAGIAHHLVETRPSCFGSRDPVRILASDLEVPLLSHLAEVVELSFRVLIKGGDSHVQGRALHKGGKRAYHNYLRYVKIKEARGEKHETLGSEGHPYTQEDLDAYKKAKTQLGLGDWLRSREIASFFFKQGFALPTRTTPLSSTTLWITRT